MSSAGIKPTDGENPTPQMPGAIDLTAPQKQPGNTAAAAPNVPAQNPPNVNGGPASFSDLTQSIVDLVKSKTSEVAASKDALVSNMNIDQTATTQINNLTKDSMEALQNMQRAESLPGGSAGELAGIIGLFDSRYNPTYQATRIKINENKAAQITSTATALKNQNNLLPDLMAKQSAAAEVLFKAQKDANDLALKSIEVDARMLQARTQAARLKIEMSQEARASTEFKIKSMSTAQLENAYAQAQTGKGPFAGVAGLIEDRLVSEKMAVTNLEKATTEMNRGNRIEANDRLTDAVSHMPTEVVAARLAEAQKSGKPFVEFPTGTKGKDGKEQTIQIPFDLTQQGLVKAMQIEQTANQTLAAKYNQDLNINPTITNVIKGANALASMDPRATQIVTNMGHLVRNWDPKDAQSTRMVGLQAKEFQKQLDDLAKENAKKFGSDQAQAAVEQFAKTGTFDTRGGTAVMVDSAGIPSLTRQSRYGNMWTTLDQEVAKVLARQHNTGLNIGTVNNNADAMSIMAQAMAKPEGKENIRTITSNILADPAKVKQLAGQMKGTIQISGLKGVIGSLAKQKGAAPVWNDIIQHSENYRDQAGNLDARKLFESMEKASVMARANGNATANYADTFLTALRNYAATADDNSASDPSYSIQDHAAEAAIFGGNPAGTVLGDLHYNFRVLAERANKEMQARIQQDLSGETQRQALHQAGFSDAVADPMVDPFGVNAKKIQTKTGLNVNTVPSATGTGLTVAQIKAIYGGGN